MAATKKKTVKKKVVKKAAKKAVNKVVKKPANKKTARKIAPKKTTTKTSDDKVKVTREQQHKMICEAAYYISLEKTYDTVSPTEDWLQAESFINKICTVHSK